MIDRDQKLKEIISENIKLNLKKNGWSQIKLSEHTNIPKSTISDYVKMKALISPGNVQKISDAFGVKKSEIDPSFSSDNSHNVTLPHNAIPIKVATATVPVYGHIAAGVPLEMIVADEHVGVPDMVKEKYPTAFFLKVNGDSMDKIIPNGAYALIKPCEEASDNDVVAVAVNGSDATLKRFRSIPNGIMLMPESNNSENQMRIFDCSKGECDEVRVIGKLVWFMTPFDMKF